MRATPPKDAATVRQAEYGSDIIVDLIRALDIPYVAFNPGSTFRWIHDSLVNYGNNHKPEIIQCCHEETSVAIAHGYAKATGHPIVAMVHNVVGLQHAAMAIYNAWCDRAPVIVMGGTGPLDVTKRRPGIDWVHTASDQGHLVRDFVKWDDQPHSLTSVPESFLRAYQAAVTPPQGPVYLCYDAELQASPIPPEFSFPDVANYSLPASIAPHGPLLSQAAKLLIEAQNPVIVADGVGRNPSAVADLVSLADLLAIPVIDGGSRFNFPSSHPLDMTGASGDILPQADVILALEVENLFGALSGPTASGEHQNIIAPQTKVIHICLGHLLSRGWAADCQRLQPTHLTITADTALALPQLIDICREMLKYDDKIRQGYTLRRSRLSQQHQELRSRWEREAEGRGEEMPISPPRLASEVYKIIKDRDWVLVNGGLTGWARRLWDFSQPNQFLGGSGGQGLGDGIGAAIGAALALAHDGKLCINLQADGDLLYCATGLWTAAHHSIPLLNIMFNNRSYYNSENHALVTARSRNRPEANRGVGTRLEEPFVDFAQLARSLGVYSEGPIEEPEAIAPALKRALRVLEVDKKPALVDVVTQSR
ncbi:MAG: thiamine pyrophosphate-binding protein [Chloroflexi bacterium]|nr:thiamine pyrophosphate-binding protein [Chloroflexota bacterium]